MRFVIIFVTAAILIGYDFIYNGGYYVRYALGEAISMWNSIISTVTGLF